MNELSKVPEKSGRAKPTLVTVGDKQIIANGRWNNDVMADHVIAHGQKKWLSIGELAKVGCGGNTIPNKRRVRARLSSLFTTLLDRGLFLAIEYNGQHYGATAVKLADVALTADYESVTAKLDRMLKRKELTEERYERSLALLSVLKGIA